MIDKIGAIIISGNKMLVARTRGLDIFFIPGGKRNDGESDLQALEREIIEELGVKIKNPRYYKTFFAKTHDGNDEVRVKSYFVELDGNPEPNSEIEELLWVDKNDFYKHKLGKILRIMIPELIKDEIL